MKPLLLVLNILGLLIFSVFSWLQHEDDNTLIYENAGSLDMWSWILFYGLVAVGFLLAVLKRFPWQLYAVVALFCVFEIATTAPGLIRNLTSDEGFNMTKTGMNPNAPQVEQTREFFGALIALGGLAFLEFQRRRAKKIA